VNSADPIPLARPDLGPREEELLLEVLRTGQLSLGPVLDRFEREFAGWLGTDDAVGVSSGTAALHLGVRALGWGSGDEVVTTPFSFVSSANCLLYEDVKPAFCDIDPLTLNMAPDAALAAVTERTVGLLPVHIFGYPAAMDGFERLAGERGLGILEDAAEAAGAVDETGAKVGTRGNITVFAFYANKQLVTGEGGIAIPSDADVAERMRSERNQGRARDMGWLGHERLGFNYRLTDLQAAMGVAQVERADELIAARSRVAALYADALGALGAAPAGEGDPDDLVLGCGDQGAARRSWFVYVLQLPVGADRDAVMTSLAAEGIDSKAYLPCIHLMPHYRERFGFREGQFPVAEAVSARSLALPFFTAMGEAEVERVAGALASALGRA
jgi:perosamine synthetase